MPKVYRLAAHEIRPLAPRRGACIASDRIVVDGARVGYMYRHPPDNEMDSGWCFLAGDESREFVHDARHFALYDVNTVANYDPAIIPFLDAPVRSAFERDPSGAFVAVPYSHDD